MHRKLTTKSNETAAGRTPFLRRYGLYAALERPGLRPTSNTMALQGRDNCRDLRGSLATLVVNLPVKNVTPHPFRRIAGAVQRVINGNKGCINQRFAGNSAAPVTVRERKVVHAHMWGMISRSTILALTLLWFMPAHAQEQTIVTKSGDVGVTRSEEASQLAIKARELFEIGMRKQDSRKLAASAEIMSRLPDVVDLRTDETAPPLEMDARRAAEGERRTSGLVPILMTPDQVMDTALEYAESQGDEALINELRETKASLPKTAQNEPSQKPCVWANCCGRWGCWRWCQWW